MKNYFKEIELKLKRNIKLERIEIIDNSHLHKPEKFHLKLNINSLYLNSISRINAQKIIMKILKDDLKNKIHALEINIEK